MFAITNFILDIEIITISDMINTSISLFGVFDGHNGAKANVWGKHKTPTNIPPSSSFEDCS